MTTRSCCIPFCDEWRLVRFGFSEVRPERFCISQWRLAPIVYVLYRFILAAYTTSWLIITANTEMDQAMPSKNSSDFVFYSWPVYLTNWTYLMLTLYLLVHFIVTLSFYCQRRSILFRRISKEYHCDLFHETKEENLGLWRNSYEDIPGLSQDLGMEGDVVVSRHQIPWYLKLTWILFNIASAASVMVTLVFFIFLWPQFEGPIDMLNLQLHGITSVIVFLEHIVTAVPVRILHVIYPIIYGLVYMVFTAIFYGAGNKDPIYPKVLDWNSDHVGQTMLMVLFVGFIIMPVLQAFFYVLYRIRICIFSKCSSD